MMPLKFKFLLAGLFVAASALMVQSFQGKPAENLERPLATYSRGTLNVTVPFHAPAAGSGQLTMQVLGPDDELLAQTTSPAQIAQGAGVWRENLKLAKPLPVEDLVWQRLHYRFAYSNSKEILEGSESISEILRMPVLRIVGQQSYLAGGPAAVRLIVMDSKNEPINGGSTARIELGNTLLYSGRLNARGTTEAQFQIPKGQSGNVPLHYVVDTPIGSTEFTQQVRVEDKLSTLLTTEKPLYQPGQTIHIRALSFDRANHEAVANRDLTFEIEDSRGNKVFKSLTKTDQFGIAWAEFHLADEVNLGAYHLRANGSEIALNVERYVLPKFKIAIEWTGKNQHGYRPGDHVTGVVRADYFFGKPVDNSEIAIKVSAADVALFDAASVNGKTDANGEYRFDLKLPAYFAGKPMNRGGARALVEASVKDSAEHSESRGEGIMISESPLILTAVPEGGTLAPNLENQVFILASYADGKPAVADIKAAGQMVTTDEGGVSVIRLMPGASTALAVEAADKEGNQVKTTVQLDARVGTDQILLRADRAVYRAGDKLQLHVLSTKSRGTAYIDIVKEGQTVVTKDVDIVNGQADLTLAVTGNLAGTLDVNAYTFGADALPIADHRLIFVQPADELKIEATANAQSYRPGDDAQVRFKVTNSKGEGVQAALGLQVVDEAVFALAEKQPGFAKVFFYLEQEALKPRYEIHSIGMSEIVEPVGAAKVEQRDRAARALFAATQLVTSNKFETELGRSIPRTKFAEYSAKYEARFVDLLNKRAVALDQFEDPWGTRVHVQNAAWNGGYMTVTSAGPDKRFDTADDVGAYAIGQARPVVGQASSGASSIESKIEHLRGPVNGRAVISGSAIDQRGAAIADATVTVRAVGGGSVRNARPDEQGAFTLSALSAGEYEVEVASSTDHVKTRVSLAPRDRAVISAHLRHETDQILKFRALGRVGTAQNGMQLAGFAGGAAGMGGGGGIRRTFAAGVLMVPPAPMAMAMRDRVADRKDAPASFALTGSVDALKAVKKEADGPAARERSYFPEALYINPEIITDQHGLASIRIPMADSITTWRMAMIASTTHGALGTATSSLKVFQDFFVDLDLPVTLTQGDRVSIPVAAYNYAGSRGDVTMTLKQENWFALVNDAAEKTITVEPGRVGGAQYTIEAKQIGKFKLTLSAKMRGGDNRADIVVREIEVIPNGREQNVVFNGRLESSVQHQMTFPPNAVPDASKVFVRLYPGPLSQVIEGMDAILRMPGGCFEQTSSSTYPNVLALDYMKRTKKLTPEVHAKAEGLIANGYQRLLTFEVPGGGFSWFGSAPANKILTAYGLMEFFDMSKVHDVDPKLIQRTQQWLASQQQADGSWKPDTSFINEGATNRYNSDVLRITAYIAWSLGNTGYQGPAVEKAKQYMEAHMGGKADSYTLAVLANFFVDYGKDREFTRRAMELLIDARTEKDEQAWWNSEETGVYSTGASASVETTALAAQALLKWGQSSATSRKALTYIAAKKDASGTWGTTQATIMALRALLLATEKGSADVSGKLEITLNGRSVETLTLTAANNDLLHQFVFKAADLKDTNAVGIRFEGKGGLAYQVVSDYFTPWNEKPSNEPLSISVNYDRTQLAQDDIAKATATVKNTLSKSANMVMIDLGIPPGFDLLSEDLQAYQDQSAGKKSGRMEKFTMTATQAILYFDSIAPGDTVTVKYRLRAKYPIHARTFQSRVYEYYDPAVGSIAKPIQLDVTKKK
jgi:uncharacterized protein YfaS (alpha-2-macroglobulin family)